MNDLEIEYEHEVPQDRVKVQIAATERKTSEFWGTVEGRAVEIIEIHWRNGEHHAVLADGRTLRDTLLVH